MIASSKKEALKIAIEIKPDLALIGIKLKTDNLDTAVIYITGNFNRN